MTGYNLIFWVQKNQYNCRCKGIVVFAMLMLMALNGQGRWCGVSPDDCKTYQDILNEFSGNIQTVGIDIATNENNVNITSGQLMLIPNGVTFTGSINDVAPDAAVCIAETGVFAPSSMKISGIIYLYNTSTALSIGPNFMGSLENYGGTINVTGIGQLYSGRYLLNCDGVINWYNSFNVNDCSIYNAGQINITGQLTGSGCIHNEAWMSVGSYASNVSFINNGKVEVIGTSLHFNGGGGTVINNCAFFSAASGANFQNNTSIENNGLIYLPIGTFENKAGKTFTNGETGVVRTKDFTNEGLINGSGWFYVTDYSKNINTGVFGQGSDTIHFYDASPGGATGYFDLVHGSASIGSSVKFTPFPEPIYSPDLSNYNCGDIILSASIDPGEIAESQILCLGIAPQPFTSVEDASCSEPGATITYQWKSSTDNLFFSYITGATDPTYSVSSRPAIKTYYLRKASATFSPPDTIKNSTGMSNVIYLEPIDEEPASISAHPSDDSACDGAEAQFTASAQNYDSYLWQESTNSGSSWASLSETSPYSDVTSGTLTIDPVTEGMNDYQYRLVAINNNCGNVYSDAATLTVIADDSPVITTQPAHQYVCPGATSATFTVVAEDECDYQWQHSTNEGANWADLSDGTDYSNVTTATLTVNSGGLTDEDQFRCVLSAVCDETTSDAAILYQVIPEVLVTPLTNNKCPDTDPALDFNSLNHEYDMGMSAISFTIERETEGSFPWSFDYEITADPALLAALQPQGTSGNISNPAGTASVELTFYLENQTEEMVEATFSITNVSVAGCTEAPNANHSATVYVRRMPVSGIFATE